MVEVTARRDLLKLLGAVPVGISSLPAAVPLAPLLLAAEPLVKTTLAVGEAGPPSVHTTQHILGKVMWHSLERAFERFEREHRIREATRINGLDHDIHAMKSWSLAKKYSMQRARDIEAGDLRARCERTLWPRH